MFYTWCIIVDHSFIGLLLYNNTISGHFSLKSLGKECFQETFIYRYIYRKVMVKLSHINLEKEGLDKFISPFEGEILTTLWKEGNLTSADLQKNLEKRDLSMHIATVSGLLSRLIDKGYVTREPMESGSKQRFIYSAKQDEKEFAELISHTILENLNNAFGTDFDQFMRSYIEQHSR